METPSGFGKNTSSELGRDSPPSDSNFDVGAKDEAMVVVSFVEEMLVVGVVWGTGHGVNEEVEGS